jgi:hypothetical protein
MPGTSQPEISYSSASQHKNASSTYFCRLANLLADEFPLVLVVFLDRCEQLCTLPLSVSFRLTGVAPEGPKTSKNSHRPLQTRRSAYPVAAVVSRGAVRNERPICAYLVPMFLYAPLCPLRKCLNHGYRISHFSPIEVTSRWSNVRIHVCILDMSVFTFAISLQLLPASLITLSLCSSAGVHGVFVLLFFALGSCTVGSRSTD